MEERCDVKLAAGLWRAGRCQRSVRLRVPEASVRRSLVDELGDATPAARVTGLLAASVDGIGEIDQPTTDDVRGLRVGDRDRIVLALRRALSGDELECVCPCACGETLELTLSIGDLVSGETAEPLPRTAEAALGSGGTVRVRAASGADQERAAEQARTDPEGAVRGLVAGCVVEPSEELDGDRLALASELLEQLDPGAEILLRGSCPSCGAELVALLDPGSYLWTELERWNEALDLEIHTLASHYHWSEGDIVALTPERRARYLELVG
jgi:hypothetical protein